jgi:hypothetical protein
MKVLVARQNNEIEAATGLRADSKIRVCEMITQKRHGWISFLLRGILKGVRPISYAWSVGVTAIKALIHRIYRGVSPISYARSIGVTIGDDCDLRCVEFGSEPYLVKIGNHVGAFQAMFATHGGAWVFRDKYPEADLMGTIEVGNNVYIGAKSIILPNVKIGDNVVIAAGSIVSKDIPSNCVAAGCPARPIKSFDEYHESFVKKMIPTKNLSPAKKKEFLLAYFKISNS